VSWHAIPYSTPETPPEFHGSRMTPLQDRFSVVQLRFASLMRFRNRGPYRNRATSALHFWIGLPIGLIIMLMLVGP
jgi:hypothetical protein